MFLLRALSIGFPRARLERAFQRIRAKTEDHVLQGAIDKAVETHVDLFKNKMTPAQTRGGVLDLFESLSAPELAAAAISSATSAALRICAGPYTTGERAVLKGLDQPDRVRTAALAYMLGLTIAHVVHRRFVDAGLANQLEPERRKSYFDKITETSFAFASPEQLEEIRRRGWHYYMALHTSDHTRSATFVKELAVLVLRLMQSWRSTEEDAEQLQEQLREHTRRVFADLKPAQQLG